MNRAFFCCCLVLIAGSPVSAGAVERRVCYYDTCEYLSVQQAIDEAAPGDVIRIAQGTYHGCLRIIGANLTIEGGWDSAFEERSTDPRATVITPDQSCDPAGDCRVLSVHAGEVESSVTVENLELSGGSTVYYRGGGGVLASAGGGGLSVTLRNVEVRANAAGYGGGIEAQATAGGSLGLSIENCVVAGNETGTSGGGLFVLADGSGSLAALSLAGSTVSGNSAESRGAGLALRSQNAGVIQATLADSILWGNRSPIGGDVYLADVGGGITLTLDHSDVGELLQALDPYGGIVVDAGGNISADPIFVNPALDDYHLNSDSPCINAGAGNGASVFDLDGQARPAGAGWDMGADERAEPPPVEMRLLACNGSELLASGQRYNLTWEAPEELVSFRLLYSLNRGRDWHLIRRRIEGKHFTWRVPRPRRNKMGRCRVKLAGRDALGTLVERDVSDRLFSIEGVRVTSPRAGDDLLAGTGAPLRLEWITNRTVETVVSTDVYLSRRAGSTWRLIASLEGNPGSFEWDLPRFSLPRERCMVKVVLRDANGNRLGRDESDGLFAIR